MVSKNLLKAITTFIILSILVIGFSIFFIFKQNLIGPIYILLGFLGIGFLRFFKITVKETKPDIIFGLIDNGILIFAASIGGIYAGIVGAVLGGAAGNTITDGLGGLFEGRIAAKQRKNNIHQKRTSLSTMLGKMIGCLFGAGIGLIILWAIQLTGRTISLTGILG